MLAKFEFGSLKSYNIVLPQIIAPGGIEKAAEKEKKTVSISVSLF